jgi:hypothetical protein
LKLIPFDLPVQAFEELQVNVIKTLERLTAFEFLSKSLRFQSNGKPSLDVAAEEVPDDENFRDGLSVVIIDHLGSIICVRNGFELNLTQKLAQELRFPFTLINRPSPSYSSNVGLPTFPLTCGRRISKPTRATNE